MLISFNILFDPPKGSGQHVRKLMESLTYPNPDYISAKRLGFSTKLIPKEIRTYKPGGESTLLISRGEIRKIKEIFPGEPVEEISCKTRALFQYENNDFALDEHQMRAVGAITSCKQGIVHAVTSAGKTHIVLAAAARLGQKTLILVHRKILVEQFLEDIKKYVKVDGRAIRKGEWGIIGDGKVEIGSHITIAMVQTYGARRFVQDFGVVFCDECHLTPASTFQNVMENLPARYRFGLTGTLKRQDKKEFLIYATFGSVIAKIDKEQLLALDRVSPVDIKIIDSDFYLSDDPDGESVTAKWARTVDEIHLDEARRDLCLDAVDSCDEGPILVLLNRVEACYEYNDAYSKRNHRSSGVITGRDSKEGIDTFRSVLEGSTHVVFATVGCVSTGVSIAELRHIILATPIFSNESLLHQVRGRLMRKADGKEKGVLHFIWDGNVFPGYKLSQFKRIMAK